jgi:hypothetical protein
LPRDAEKDRAKLLETGWKLLADGNVAFAPIVDVATIPTTGNLLIAGIRFELKIPDGSGRTRVEQLQVALSPHQCRAVAEQLLAGADYLDKEMARPPGKPN